jgi:hypothetical protein
VSKGQGGNLSPLPSFKKGKRVMAKEKISTIGKEKTFDKAKHQEKVKKAKKK